MSANLQNFALRAGTYNCGASVQMRVAEWLAEWLEFSAGDVLEVGAGTGIFTQKLCRYFENVCATDLEFAMIEQGKINCPNAHWRKEDAWNLPEKCCDFLCSSSMLQWAPDLPRVLKNMKNALRKNGKMLHAFFIEPTLCELASLAGTPVAWRDETIWRKAFADAGLKILRAETKIIKENYPSALALLRQIHATGATSAAGTLVPEKLRAIIKIYDQQFRVPAGTGVFATWAAMRVECI